MHNNYSRDKLLLVILKNNYRKQVIKMAKLIADQKTVKELFENKKSDFLIPDYQRPYAWTETECQTLWEDIHMFAFPNDNCDEFNNSDEYFLGPIVTFRNSEDQIEVIDGQQRLTTLMLLLRAIYEKLKYMQDEKIRKIRENIESCIWKTDELGDSDKETLKINSEVATDKDKDELLKILKTGKVNNSQNSKYAINYRFFQKKIDEFVDKYSAFYGLLPARILNNCIILVIEADSQDAALRIFSTLNDRGKPLSDADIFKAQFYKYYSDKNINKKEEFIHKWKNLESLCNRIFKPTNISPMDELFTRYMYYERAKKGIKFTTTMGLRKFYEQNNYELLHNENTFENLIDLADFWEDILTQNKKRFSSNVLKKLFVLDYAPNNMWTYIVSVYFMHNRDQNNFLNEEKFYDFLNKITSFIWAYSIVNPGVSALRAPIFNEMINIVNSKPVEFSNYKFNINNIKNIYDNFNFSNGRPITKAMLAWWAFSFDDQILLPIQSVFEIEHIFAKRRQVKENSLEDPDNLELLGNKSLLEQNINISASDYKFHDKIRYYNGYVNNKKQVKSGTNIKELLKLAGSEKDFTELNILSRNTKIKTKFINFLKENNLITKKNLKLFL